MTLNTTKTPHCLHASAWQALALTNNAHAAEMLADLLWRVAGVLVLELCEKRRERERESVCVCVCVCPPLSLHLSLSLSTSLSSPLPNQPPSPPLPSSAYHLQCALWRLEGVDVVLREAADLQPLVARHHSLHGLQLLIHNLQQC